MSENVTKEGIMKRIKRLLRMALMFIQGEITWKNFLASLRMNQKSVCLVAGGTVFCDREDERLFFQEDDEEMAAPDQRCPGCHSYGNCCDSGVWACPKP